MFELFDPEADYQVIDGSSLPHWFQPGATYFVTFRTEDSIPLDVSRRWHADRARWLFKHGIDITHGDWQLQFASLPENHRRTYHDTFTQGFMEDLDKGLGKCILRDPACSKIVSDCLLHFDGDRYQISDFVIMPNHVHVLVGLNRDTSIISQCYSWKKFSAGKIHKLVGSKGRFWQEESFDHLVRSPEQFQAIQRYIAQNPSGLNAQDYVLYSRTK